MDDILEVLESSPTDEADITKSLRNQAYQLITSKPSQSPWPQTLQDLLIRVVKPLFSKTQHPSITSTGRKNLISAPSLPNRFGNDSIFEPPPPWKNEWTITLLSWILQQHNTIPEHDRKKAIENHFHLLVPPLLHLIDDTELSYKASGCDCLTILCNTLTSVESEILKRTGLTEVFIEALKNCFHYLPTLTPEDESLLLLQSLYPTYLALIRARFVLLNEYISPTGESTTSVISTQDNDNPKDHLDIENVTTRPRNSSTTKKPLSSKMTLTIISTDLTARNTYLTHLLRHSLLHGLAHLTLSSSTTSLVHSTAPTITIYLLSRLREVLRLLSLDANVHLQSLIPLLVGTLMDPFASAALHVLENVIDALEGVVCVCWVRVRVRWWVEVLRGLVVVWGVLVDDLDDGVKRVEVHGVLKKVERLVTVLGDVVGEENFGPVVESLVREEEELEPLFREWKKDRG